MCLLAKRILDGCDDRAEHRRMCSVLESVQNRCTVSARDVELTWAILVEIDCEDALDLFFVGMYGDWERSAMSHK